VIFELNQDNFKKILPLYSKEEIVFPLILAVLEQKQSGWVWVDDLVSPVSAMVIAKSGFMQLVGMEGGEDFGLNVIKFLKSPSLYMPTYLLWYLPPIQIQKILDEYIPKYVRKRDRAHFILEKQIVETPAKCPTGFDVHLLDKDLIEKIGHYKLDIGSRFWASPEDFLENGVGACVMKEGEIVSLCYSACIAGYFAEIDVITQEEYRGMGLAVVAARSFISECVKREITPTWDCFVNNTASMKLADRLGFTQTVIYPFYSFNIPTNFQAKVNLPVERGVA